MGGSLLDRVRELLRALETAQRDLSSLQDRKRAALTRGESSELLGIAREETILSNRLRDLLQQRSQILESARVAGAEDTGSLSSFVATLPPAEREELEPRVVQARRHAERIRRETWVQWIIAHRAYSHYSSLLELIAQSGSKSPTYDEKPVKHSSGGAIFDASI